MGVMGNKINTAMMNLPELNTLNQIDQFKGASFERSGMNTVLGNYNTDKKTPTVRSRNPTMDGIREAVKHNNLMLSTTNNVTPRIDASQRTPKE